MKALLYQRYGGPEVLTVVELERPVPARDQLLVKIHATTVNRTDNATIRAIPFLARLVTGLIRPRWPIPGSEFAGVVEATGEAVSGFEVGDRVYGFQDLGAGAHAEYLVVKADYAVRMPDSISFAQAAAGSEGLHYAWNSTRKLYSRASTSALVYGASGAIGSAAVQLLKFRGLAVTAVCSTRHTGLLRTLGADKVVDYTKQDFANEVFEHDSQRYDLVFDAVGKASFFRCYRLLKRGGMYVSSDLGFMAQNIVLPIITPLIRFVLGGRCTVSPFPTDIPYSLALRNRMIEAGSWQPVIDRQYRFDEIIEAYRYVAEEHKTGNVVINLDSAS